MSNSHLASHGRGGAGNMVDASKTSKVDPSEFETPTLKNPMVTTGRGGTGNMARNADPRETRQLQDVEAVPRRHSHGAQHSGRGGAGNVFKNEDGDFLASQNGSNETAVEDDRSKSTSTIAVPAATKHWFFSRRG